MKDIKLVRLNTFSRINDEEIDKVIMKMEDERK